MRFRRIFTIRILHVCLLIFSKVPVHLPVLHLSAFRLLHLSAFRFRLDAGPDT